MLARLGNVIYWASGLIGAFILFLGFMDSRIHGSWEEYGGSNPIDWRGMIGYAVGSVLALLIGWAIRYILSGNKSFKP